MLTKMAPISKVIVTREKALMGRNLERTSMKIRILTAIMEMMTKITPKM